MASYRDFTIVVERNGEIERRYKLAQQTTRIGRASDNELSLDSDVEESSVSTYHVQVEFKSDQLHVRDRKSTNGSWLDNQQLLPHEMTPWPEEATLRIGDYHLKVHREAGWATDLGTKLSRFSPLLEIVITQLQTPLRIPLWVALGVVLLIAALMWNLSTVQRAGPVVRELLETRTPQPTYTPTAASMLTVTPVATLAVPTNPLSVTATPTSVPLPNRSGSLGPGNQSVAVVSNSVGNLPIPDVDFVVVERVLLNKKENGECRGMHMFFATVIDAAGNPLNNITLQGVYAPTSNQLITGSKGDGKAEIPIWGDGEDFRVSRDQNGAEVTSETVTGITPNSLLIPNETLIGAGYCDSDFACEQFKSTAGCKGHHSWRVTFQRTS